MNEVNGLFSDVSHKKVIFYRLFSLSSVLPVFYLHILFIFHTRLPAHQKCQHTPSLTHTHAHIHTLSLPSSVRKKEKLDVHFIHDRLIKLFMIKDFYIVHAQLWLLIVVLVEVYLPFCDLEACDLEDNVCSWRA